MALRNILLDGDPTLRKISRPVTDFNARIQMLIDDMRETLIDAQGLGLAAPQVGILRRVILIVNNDGEMIELVNPELVEQSEETVGAYEGCLSVPGERGWLERSKVVRVRAQDRNGEFFEKELDEMAARAVAHEIDHLNGVLFTDLTDELYTEEELEQMLQEEEEKENRKEQ